MAVRIIGNRRRVKITDIDEFLLDDLDDLADTFAGSPTDTDFSQSPTVSVIYTFDNVIVAREFRDSARELIGALT